MLTQWLATFQLLRHFSGQTGRTHLGLHRKLRYADLLVRRGTQEVRLRDEYRLRLYTAAQFRPRCWIRSPAWRSATCTISVMRLTVRWR